MWLWLCYVDIGVFLGHCASGHCDQHFSFAKASGHLRYSAAYANTIKRPAEGVAEQAGKKPKLEAPNPKGKAKAEPKPKAEAKAKGEPKPKAEAKAKAAAGDLSDKLKAMLAKAAAGGGGSASS